MLQVKETISKLILKSLSDSVNISVDDIIQHLEIPKSNENGNFAFPCFKLSKVLKKSPNQIAEEIKGNIQIEAPITDIKSVNGYLNFYVEMSLFNDDLLKNLYSILNKNTILEIGNNETILVDYSSPNIAKPFHLGHLRTTIIGRALYNVHKEMGYKVVGINYLGDWGRQFGLLIEGYNRFKSEYDIDKNPLATLSEIYVRITKLSKEDETILDLARQNFKKLEEGDEESLKLWKYFRDISLNEYNKIYDTLGCKFDSYNGEAYYNDKMQEVIDILDNKGVLIDSQGAKVVMLNENEPPCIIVKSNGSTIYATRDLAAILDRSRTYNFKKAIYVTSYEQIHHFNQIFRVAKYIVDEKYTEGLVHVPYGMVRLKTGKMSTRDGNVVYLQDLIDEAISKSLEITSNKYIDNTEIDKEVLAKQIGIGALVFNNLKSNKIKDIIFDLDEMLRFDGETGPYIQYTYVRTKSILEKTGFKLEEVNLNDCDFSLLSSEYELQLINELNNLTNVVLEVANNYEPSILVRYLIEIASLFSKFYANCPVINNDKNLEKSRIVLVYITGEVLKRCMKILGIESPNKM